MSPVVRLLWSAHAAILVLVLALLLWSSCCSFLVVRELFLADSFRAPGSDTCSGTPEDGNVTTGSPLYASSLFALCFRTLYSAGWYRDGMVSMRLVVVAAMLLGVIVFVSLLSLAL